MSTPREQVKVFFFFWSKPNHAFNTTLNKSYVHFFEYIKSNCTQILKNLQITIMNLWLQINELLTNVFSFFLSFIFFIFLFLNCVVVLHILTLEIVSRGQRSNIETPILILCQITDTSNSSIK